MESEVCAEVCAISMTFHTPDIASALEAAAYQELDGYPFGIIEVDDAGVVLYYSRFEAAFSGLDPAEVVGRDFFTEVAPCTDNRLFHGRFKRGVRRGDMDETFAFVFSYRMRPILVNVRLVRSSQGRNWVLVQEKNPSSPRRPGVEQGTASSALAASTDATRYKALGGSINSLAGHAAS